MIGKVTRGRQVGGLLRYLFGPGRANEHLDPHLVGSWDEVGDLEPPVMDSGKRNLRRLTALLEQPVTAVAKAPAKPVWHCSLRVAPSDRRLTDAEWETVARDVLDATGFAPAGDDEACRWVAVRHADDHIHLVVTLARQDGRRVSTSNDFYKLGQACRDAEQRLGLTSTAPRDRTAAKRPTRAEHEKAKRSRQAEPPRVTLRRDVSRVAAAATGEHHFFAGLRSAGLLVRERYSSVNPDQVTGYAVALPGDRGRGGQPVWFGGGKLAPDLSLPKLRKRWSEPAGSACTGPPQGLATGADRHAAWADATSSASAAAAHIGGHAASNPDQATADANAASDVLAAAARVVDRSTRGPLCQAADALDRAGREPWGRIPAGTSTSRALRTSARALSRLGRASKSEEQQARELLWSLARLADAVVALREAQGRAAQAHAAGDAARHLRAAANHYGHRLPAGRAQVPIRRHRGVVSREGVHR